MILIASPQTSFRTPANFGAYMRAENARWGKVVRDAGVVPQ